MSTTQTTTYAATDSYGRCPTVTRSGGEWVARYSQRGGMGQRVESPALPSLRAAERWLTSEGLILTSSLRRV